MCLYGVNNKKLKAFSYSISILLQPVLKLAWLLRLSLELKTGYLPWKTTQTKTNNKHGKYPVLSSNDTSTSFWSWSGDSLDASKLFSLPIAFLIHHFIRFCHIDYINICVFSSVALILFCEESKIMTTSLISWSRTLFWIEAGLEGKTPKYWCFQFFEVSKIRELLRFPGQTSV